MAAMRARKKRVLSSVYVDDSIDVALGELARPKQMTKDELASAFVTKGLTKAFGAGRVRFAEKLSAGMVIVPRKAATARKGAASLISIFVPEDVDGKLAKFATGKRYSKGEAIRDLTLMGIEDALVSSASKGPRRKVGIAGLGAELQKVDRRRA